MARLRDDRLQFSLAASRPMHGNTSRVVLFIRLSRSRSMSSLRLGGSFGGRPLGFPVALCLFMVRIILYFSLCWPQGYFVFACVVLVVARKMPLGTRLRSAWLALFAAHCGHFASLVRSIASQSAWLPSAFASAHSRATAFGPARLRPSTCALSVHASFRATTSTTHPHPHTMHTHSTLNPQPSTLNPQPSTLHP